jgi:hypothetical protein
VLSPSHRDGQRRAVTGLSLLIQSQYRVRVGQISLQESLK